MALSGTGGVGHRRVARHRPSLRSETRHRRRRGWRVAARNQEKLNELVSEITAAGGKAAAFISRRHRRRAGQVHHQGGRGAVRQDRYSGE